MTFQDCANPEELMNINQGSDCWVRLGPHAGGFFRSVYFKLDSDSESSPLDGDNISSAEIFSFKFTICFL